MYGMTHMHTRLGLLFFNIVAAAATTCSLYVPTSVWDCTNRNISVIEPLNASGSYAQVDYSMNPIEILPSLTFVGVDIQMFLFIYVPLKRVNARAFCNLSTTTTVYFTRTLLETIEVDAFTNMPRLSDLIISSNLPDLSVCFPWPNILTNNTRPLFVTIRTPGYIVARYELSALLYCGATLAPTSTAPTASTSTPSASLAAATGFTDLQYSSIIGILGMICIVAVYRWLSPQVKQKHTGTDAIISRTETSTVMNHDTYLGTYDQRTMTADATYETSTIGTNSLLVTQGNNTSVLPNNDGTYGFYNKASATNETIYSNLHTNDND